MAILQVDRPPLFHPKTLLIEKLKMQPAILPLARLDVRRRSSTEKSNSSNWFST